MTLARKRQAPPKGVERRRSPRFSRSLPLMVGGNMPSGKFFRDKAFTRIVSAHGALLHMQPVVNRGTILELSRPQKYGFALARVVHVGADVVDGMVPVAVEFLRPERRFWVA